VRCRTYVRDLAEYLKGLAHDSFAPYGVNPEDIVLAVHTEDIPLGLDAATTPATRELAHEGDVGSSAVRGGPCRSGEFAS